MRPRWKSSIPIALVFLWGCAGLQQSTMRSDLPVATLKLAAPSHPASPPTEDPATQQSAPPLGCHYIWATRELPILSTKLSAQLAGAPDPFEISAYAFGEECRLESGEANFLAMETDFRVHAAVDFLGNDEALGSAILTAMAVIETLPPEELAGTRLGRVEFEFSAPDSQSLHLNIEITRFQQEAAGLRGAELFRHFHSSP